MGRTDPMFDLGSAVVLGLVLMGLTALVHSLVLGTNTDRLKTVCCIVVGVGAVLLVGASDFAGEQVLLNHKLSTLNLWSQLLVGLLAAGVASGVWQIGPKAISNIGQVMPKYPSAKFSDRHVTDVAGTGLVGVRQDVTVTPSTTTLDPETRARYEALRRDAEALGVDPEKPHAS